MEEDLEFLFGNHVFWHGLEVGLSETDAIAEMMEIYQTPLNREHPLWELHSFENLEGDRTALIWKVHHCLVDGVSGVELLQVMYDFRAEPEDVAPPARPWVAAPPSSIVRRFAEGILNQRPNAANSTI